MPAPKKFRVPGQELPPVKSVKPKAEAPKAVVLRDPLLDRPKPRNVREALKDKWGNITTRAINWLDEGDRLETLLSETKLRDVGVFLGIATEKVLLMEGQPTQIIGQPQQAKLDQLGQALQTALAQRGLSKEVKLTERTATITLDAPRPSQQTRPD